MTKPVQSLAFQFRALSIVSDEISPNMWDDALRVAEEHIREAEQPRECFECFADPQLVCWPTSLAEVLPRSCRVLINSRCSASMLAG